MNTTPKPPFGYMGGKQRVAKQILKYVPDHMIYVEPFFGSGAIFFAKGYKEVTNKSNYKEVIGDLDSNITNFFEQLRTQPDIMQEKLCLFEYSEDLYQKAKTNSEYYKNSDALTKACLFYFNILSSFGGGINKGFAYSKLNNHAQAFKTKRQDLIKFSGRLTDCFIFNKSYAELIKKFDSDTTFFYFDPPYINTEKYTIQKEHAFDYDKFVTDLKNIKGKFILSHYKDEWLLKNFPETEYYYADITHSALLNKKLDSEGKRVGKKVKECIVMNYNPDEVELYNGSTIHSNKNEIENHKKEVKQKKLF